MRVSIATQVQFSEENGSISLPLCYEKWKNTRVNICIQVERKFKYQPDPAFLISIKFSSITVIALITPFILCFVDSIHRNMSLHEYSHILSIVFLQKLVCTFNKSDKKLFDAISIEIEISGPISFKVNKEFKFQTQNALNI